MHLHDPHVASRCNGALHQAEAALARIGSGAVGHAEFARVGEAGALVGDAGDGFYCGVRARMRARKQLQYTRMHAPASGQARMLERARTRNTGTSTRTRTSRRARARSSRAAT